MSLSHISQGVVRRTKPLEGGHAQFPSVKVEHVWIAVWNAAPWLNEIVRTDVQPKRRTDRQIEQIWIPRLRWPQWSDQNELGLF